MNNNLVKITRQFLVELKHAEVTTRAIGQLLKKHPVDSSLLSVSDALKEWGIENYVVDQSKNTTIALEKYPTPFIAQLDSRLDEFVIVKKYSAAEKTLDIHSSFRGGQKMKEADFLESWKHVALLASLESSIKGYDVHKHKKQGLLIQFKKAIVYFLLACFVLGISFLAFYFTNVIYTGFVILKIIGLVVCLFIYRYEFLNKGEETMNAICSFGGASSNNCSQLITSKKQKMFGLISWSELGVFYFSGSILAFLFTFQNYETATVLFKGLNFLCLLFVPYSIYFQKIIVKKWCTLCLGVLLMFTVEFLLLHFMSLPVIGFLLLDTILFGFAFAIPLVIYFFVEEYIKGVPEYEQKNRELNHMKFQDGMFDYTLSRADKIDQSIINQPVFLKESELSEKDSLIIALNPFCPPCKKEFSLIDALLNGFYPSLEIQVLIASSKNDQSESYKVGFMFYCIYKEKGIQGLREIMKEWYGGENDKKRPLHFKTDEVPNEYKKEYKEHLESISSFIRFTPVVFFNEFALPYPYSIADLKYLID